MDRHVSDATGRRITRRRFLWATALGGAGLLAGCAPNPVTGRSQLMLVSEASEIGMDRSASPHQFSADYGPVQDAALNNYIDGLGRRMAALSHRPQMPYSFRCVNAVYINAYAFPAGSIAVTRGILLKLDSEAELAALLGHELGHVNARHTAEQLSKRTLTSTLLGGVSAVVGSGQPLIGDIVSGLGAVGAGALLAAYSRENEREADDLGMEYMVRAGYTPRGMIALMEVLNGLAKSRPSAAQLLFSTHPMSTERYQTSVERAQVRYPQALSLPLQRERFMDYTAALRSAGKSIEMMEKAQASMGRENLSEAESLLKEALRLSPEDYTGLVMMSKTLLLAKREGEARRFVENAKRVYPGEAQAHYVSGFIHLRLSRYDEAFSDYDRYDRLLPGTPAPSFFRGYCREKAGRIPEAAGFYRSYLQEVQEGSQAQYAYKRLVEWGYIRR